MAQADLSEDCKQRLRDLDRGLTSLIASMRSKDILQSVKFASADVIPHFLAAQVADEPCREVLRSLDGSAALTSLTWLQSYSGFSFGEGLQAVTRLEILQDRIRAALGD